MIKSFNPPAVWAPFGPFSMGVVHGNGRIVHVKGQVALDVDGDVVGRGDMHAQTRQVLSGFTGRSCWWRSAPSRRFRTSGSSNGKHKDRS